MTAGKRRLMFATVDLHEMNDRIDHGANWRDTVYATAKLYPEYSDMIRLWHDRWSEMASPVILGSWEILRRLRLQGTPVYALSNFGIESFAYAEKLYPELSEFDMRFITGHMGITKPAQRIYEMLEAETGMSGSQLFLWMTGKTISTRPSRWGGRGMYLHHQNCLNMNLLGLVF